MTKWALQDARNKFSAVVEAALAGTPQQVTRRGKPAVVVLSTTEYERLRRMDKAATPDLADLLLEMPQGGEDYERLEVAPRKVEF